MQTHKVTSLKELETLAKEISKTIKDHSLIYLNGELGAGKTTFTQFLLKDLGVSENVTSPTFTFLKTYTGKKHTIYHYDLYRMEEKARKENKITILEQIQFFENCNDKQGIVIVEWAEKAKDVLPVADLEIGIKVLDMHRELIVK